MVTLLIALAVGTATPPPRVAHPVSRALSAERLALVRQQPKPHLRHAKYGGPRAEAQSYALEMTRAQYIESEDGHGWIAPMPYPVHHKHRRHK